MKKLLPLGLLVLGAPGHRAAAQTSPAARGIALDTVAVTGKVRQLTLLPPGERGRTPHGAPLSPGRQVAVLHRPPTTAHEYDIRSVTLHFSSRFNAGRAGRALVQLALPDSSGNPSATYLLPAAYELTARQIRRASRQVVTLSLQGARLTLPKQGIFVLLTGLPDAGERFVKDTTVAQQRTVPPRMAVTKTQNSRTGSYRLVNVADYIQPALVRTAQQPISWLLSQHDAKWHQLSASYPNCPQCLVFNYWIDLGVAEL